MLIAGTAILVRVPQPTQLLQDRQIHGYSFKSSKPKVVHVDKVKYK